MPLLCYILLDRGGVHRISGSDPGVKERMMADKPGARRYKKVLQLFITRRWVGIAVTFGICVISVVSIALAGSELIPEMDQGQISVSVGMPNGSTCLLYTSSLVRANPLC